MANATSRGFWAWLKVKSNRTVLAWIGAGLVAVAGGVWKGYLYFEERTQKERASTISAEQKTKAPAEQTKRAAPDSSASGNEEKSSGAPIQQKAEASKGGTAINVGRDVNINK